MFDQEKWAEHLQKLKPFILTSLVIFAGLIVMVKTTRTGGKSKVQDYFAVNLAMDAWNQNPSDENWLALRNKLDSHPELYKKFGGHIAQKFLYAGKDSPIEFEGKKGSRSIHWELITYKSLFPCFLNQCPPLHDRKENLMAFFPHSF